jgi:hypothetical protein
MGEAMRPRRIATHLRPTNVLSTLLLVAVLGVGSAVAGGNAGSAGGFDVVPLSYTADADSPESVILEASTLRILASCDPDGALVWKAETTVDDAAYYSFGSGSDEFVGDFDTTAPEDLGKNIERDAVYTNPQGDIVALQYLASDGGASPAATCLVSGYAFVR